jgi:bacterial/archaeal transporter family protein
MINWLGWALLAAVFAALTALLAKAGVAQIDPDVATLIRSCVIVVVLMILVAASGQLHTLSDTPARTWLLLVLSGLATGASWLCYFRALRLGDAARVAPIDKLSVVLVATFGVAFLGERLSLLNWLGVVLIAAGAWLVAIR